MKLVFPVVRMGIENLTSVLGILNSSKTKSALVKLLVLTFISRTIYSYLLNTTPHRISTIAGNSANQCRWAA